MKPRTRERLIGLVTGVICTMVAFALIEIVGAEPQPLKRMEDPISCIAPDLRDRVRAIMLQGLDEGLRKRVEILYEGWLRDPRDQPLRATQGMRTAIRAWSQARRVVEQWNPPDCP